MEMVDVEFVDCFDFDTLPDTNMFVSEAVCAPLYEVFMHHSKVCRTGDAFRRKAYRDVVEKKPHLSVQWLRNPEAHVQ